MSLFPDPITDLLGLFLKRALDAKLMRYATLLLEMAIAATISGLGAGGIALLSQQPVAWAAGAGMTAAAVALLATFQASPNSKGLVISLQQKIAAERIDTPITTIERK